MTGRNHLLRSNLNLVVVFSESCVEKLCIAFFSSSPSAAAKLDRVTNLSVLENISGIERVF